MIDDEVYRYIIEKGSDDRTRAISVIEKRTGKREVEGRWEEEGRRVDYLTRSGPKARPAKFFDLFF